MQKVLQVKNASKIYGGKTNSYTALDHVSFDVQQGEFVGIMGPSGAGKTTLLNIISTIDSPTSGEILIDGSDVVKMKEDKLAMFRRTKLGFIFQDYNLLDSLTVRENIALPLALTKVKAKEIDKRVEDIAKRFGIEHILEQYPYQISGGQKQRCAASRAIVTNPSLIFGDEPTGALDSKSSADLLQCLQTLNQEEQATILMVTHDANAGSYCERILFITDGKISIELKKGTQTRKEFFQRIMDVLAELGGDMSDAI
ncbi:bacitracin ABC transporter ATP-binding protein [Brevibacillus sp. SKDU10]|uniref:ABC transporter ATP-binding protein n=1 Tax=Brevibacillus TaxID=55080 RepID=UPI0007C8E0DB|nr:MULTISPECIES: ABC transporter ATP-binding protein [Brevibacillus]OAJ74661.1 bacitracin ABC transporter ATP-binding protein [Brevibacillus sp. SKDU10]GIO03486.1 ABC transporter ATP-binding protein [Brevibacillus halotolerans]